MEEQQLQTPAVNGITETNELARVKLEADMDT